MGFQGPGLGPHDLPKDAKEKKIRLIFSSLILSRKHSEKISPYLSLHFTPDTQRLFIVFVFIHSTHVKHRWSDLLRLFIDRSYTRRNILQTSLNQTEIRLYLLFFSIDLEQQMDTVRLLFQINREK